MREDLQMSPFTGNVFSRPPGRALKEAGGLPALRTANYPRVSTELSRIIRRQAAGNWMLPTLASITPTYIETILRGALGGNHVQQWELFDLMEDTWPRLLKDLNELKGAVAQMDWKLEAWADEDQPPTPSAVERCRLIQDAVWSMRPAPDSDDNGFEQTLADILDAWAKGVSVQEIVWEQRRIGNLGEFTVPQCTYWVHPRNYAWSEEGFLGLNLQSDNSAGVYTPRSATVQRFPENKFLVALAKAKSGPPMTSALLRPLAWWWCAANFSADWLMNLAQLFGLPFRWATYAQDASDDTVAEIGDLLANMGSNGYGAFPEGTNLNFLEGGKNAGASPQADLMERADKNCDLLILGQTLTSDTGGSGAGGGSLALGKVHAGVRGQIFQSAANFVARVLNQQLIPAILLENYGDTEEAPYFCPETETQKDLNQTAALIQTAVATGFKVPAKWAHAELNIPLPQAGEEIIQPAAPASPFGAAPRGGNGDAGPEKDDAEAESAADTTPMSARDNADEGEWRTINGSPVLIKKGQSVSEAIKEKFGDRNGEADREVAAEKQTLSERVRAAAVKIKPVKQRAFNGEPIATKTKLSKQEAGAIGERLVIEHLKANGMKDARPLNAGQSNYAVDLVQDHGAIEVKTGLVSNGKSAQQWRATIGQPGKEESAKLAKMSAEKKAAWNQAKADAILRRKQAVVEALGKKLGRPVKSWTMTTIINPDTRTVDVYRFKGFHLRIPWNSDAAKQAYVGSYKYEA